MQAVYCQDEDAFTPGPVHGIVEVFADERPILHLDRCQLAAAHADEGQRGACLAPGF